MTSRNDYSGWSKEDLIKKLKALEKRKKYGLVWDAAREPEKVVLDCQNELPVLKEVKEKEIHSGKDDIIHILIEGDNYHALSVLNYTHEKAIDVIYIDPPYNTGNDDFIYNDRYIDGEDPYRHSKWLTFMEKRLRLARNLLKSSGVIFISIDDNEFAQLKLLCDEIFNEPNFIIDAIWNSRKSVSSDAIVSLNHNHTLVYSKNIDVLREDIKKKNRFKLPAKEDKFSNLDSDPRGPWTADPFEAAGVRKNLSYAIKNPNSGKIYYPVTGRHWAVLEDEYFKLLADNRIVFGKNGTGKPARKRFMTDAMEKGLTPKSIWDDVGTTTNGTQELEEILGEKKFNNPKPVSLLRRILELATDSHSVVLDFMAGSGTTGHSVLQLNSEDNGRRQFILCTNNENDICTEVCYPRVQKVIKGYENSKGEVVEGLGGNLKYYQTAFVPASPTDKNKELLTKQSIEMLTLKEGTFEKVTENPSYSIYRNSDKYTGIIFDQLSFADFKKAVTKIDKPISLYIFSLADEDFSDDFADMKGLVKICAIPESILRVYRRIFR